MTAIYALELLIGKVFKMASQKADKGMETVVKAETEQTPVKRVKSFVKDKSEPVPEMPKKSALASKYPRLADIYHKLEKKIQPFMRGKRSLPAWKRSLPEQKVSSKQNSVRSCRSRQNSYRRR